MAFSGAYMHLGNLAKLSTAQTRLITAENVFGEKGRGGMAQNTEEPQEEVKRIGQHWDGPNRYVKHLGLSKWKVRPAISIPSGTTATIMDIAGPGVIQHFWVTLQEKLYRDLILRMYWDGETLPSVEVPMGDFFCNGWRMFVPVNAVPINANPKCGLNCYFTMPFRKHARITVENRAPETVGLFYAITYAQTAVEHDDAYFHAQFRRTNPVPLGQDYVILDNVSGQGQYVGTYMAWQQNVHGWFGEGEIKIFLDGDGEFPTLCGTGTEDYFGGAWGFQENYSAPFLGYPLTFPSQHGTVSYQVGTRHGLYRFHVMDPIRFQRDIRVTMQVLGWQSEQRLHPCSDDIASVAYWYQTEPHAVFPALGDRNALEVR